MLRTIALCASLVLSQVVLAQSLIDGKASKKTNNLYQNLKNSAQKNVLIGHQDDMAYGVKWQAKKGRSDVRETVGSYPAMHGWTIDFSENVYNNDSIKYDQMKLWMREVYSRGGINTLSWRPTYPDTQKTPFISNLEPANVLPGASLHQEYLILLNQLALFISQLNMPVILRLFDQHNAREVWWGNGTEASFVSLWRFTIDYLKEVKKVHNIIYAYSPNRSFMEESNMDKDYFYGYPGDDYVDVFGLVNYIEFEDTEVKRQIASNKFKNDLMYIDRLAQKKNKLAAITETGQNGLMDSLWFSQTLLTSFEALDHGALGWVTLGPNKDTTHYYIPFDEHPAAVDFREFRKNQLTIFENDLVEIYK